MKVAALVLVALIASACSAPPATPPTAKVLTDDEFVAKVSAKVNADAQFGQTTASTPGPLFASYNAAGAAKACQTFVLNGLKAPASAKFPEHVTTTEDLGEGRFRVQAAVDAQNGFGALIRNNYDCSVHWVSGSDWGLDDLDLKSR
jgi:hypothetical protein